MWLCATRNRPEDCKRLIAAMQAVDDVPEVAVMIDDDPKRYADVPWPGHWFVHVAPEHLEMTRAINMLQDMYGGRKFYGMFADHFRPLTKWSAPLVAAAGDWFVSWPEDNYVSGWQVSAAPCFGSKLVKELGYICNPRSIHLGTEHPWIWLWKYLNIGRRVEEVIVTHDLHELNNRGLDSNRARIYKGRFYEPDDTRAWAEWVEHDSTRIVNGIRAGMEADGYRFDKDGRLIMDGMTPPPP